MPFDSPDLALSDILKDVSVGKVQLPDFQREWKWDTDMIGSLLASISQDHPVGVVMMLEVGGDDGVQFLPRPISGVELNGEATPERLILDGQQRLTSLFQSLYSSGKPVDTKDARGKKLKRWFYVDIAKALDPNGDREEAIVAVPEDRIIYDYIRRETLADYSTIEKECEAEMFPLHLVYDSAHIFAWHGKYLSSADDKGAQSDRWNEFYSEVLENFIAYKVPVIVLKKETPKEAVCVVFEKVNTGGVVLNVFELLTATFAADNFRLNDDWRARQERLYKRPVLKGVQSTDFLQAITLLATRDRREKFLAGGGDPGDAPGISAKRKDTLRLTLHEYKTWADPVTEALEWAAGFLASEHVHRSKDLPYNTQLVPLSAVRVVLGVEADNLGAAGKIRRWYWSGILGELYGSATDSRFARDLPELVDWVRGGREPATVTEALFHPARLLTLKTRNSAAYKGVYALLMKSGCLDWQRNQKIDYATFFEYSLDIHHIFPQAWCKKQDPPIDADRMDSIVNKTAISSATNQSIGGRAPSVYMRTLAKNAGVGDEELDSIIASHACDPALMRKDDFDAFFYSRSKALQELIGEAMGKPVAEDTGEDESPEAFEEEDSLEQIEEEIDAAEGAVA